MHSSCRRAALKGSTAASICNSLVSRSFILNTANGARLTAFRPAATDAELVQALLSELTATRKQVDKLLDHQALLLGMLQQQQHAPSGGHSDMPLTVATANGSGRASSNSLLEDMINTKITFEDASSTSSSSNSSVLQVLSSLGTGTVAAAATSPAGSLISEALQQAAQQDVLQEGTIQMPGSTPSTAATQALPSAQGNEMLLPVLEPGLRHAWWMEQLHVALLARGYYAGDQDVQSWMFGQGTADALQRFQKDSGIPQTGVTDAVTWAAILSDLPKLQGDIAHAMATGKAPTPPASATSSITVQPNGEKEEAYTTSQQAETQQASMLPRLQMGDGLEDDAELKWVSWLHRALTSAGFHPPEEECEEWFFGEGTKEAVLTAQATAGLEETGVVDTTTWSWLLRYPDGDGDVRAEVEAKLGASIQMLASGHASQQPAATSSQVVSSHAVAADQRSSTPSEAWPVVVEGDGGVAVGVLQRALQANGYHCGDDEPTYWQFGADTGNALRTFQACSGLIESGVCDKFTWHSLLTALGVSNVNSVDELHQHLKSVSGNDDEEDIVQGQQHGRVWLVGEQRWEIRG